MEHLSEKCDDSLALLTARKNLETATTKRNPVNKRKYLLASIHTVQTVLASNPLLGKWESAVVLGNLANSIEAGIEDDETIPKSDVEEFETALADFAGRYEDYLTDQDDLDQDEKSRIEEESRKERTKMVNDALKANTPNLGMKALAIVAGDLSELRSGESENSERQAQASLENLRRNNNKDINDEEYIKLVHQLDNIEPYLERMRLKIPRGFNERFVVLRQPVLVVGDVLRNPSAKAKNYVAKHGIEMGGYWVLKDQIMLGVTTNVSKVVKSAKFRESVVERLTDIYEADLEKRIKRHKMSERQIHTERLAMMKRLADDIDEEMENLSRAVNIKSVLKLLSKQLGYEVVAMEGVSRVKGSPYTYYWLVSTDMTQNVLKGLYSDVTNWSLPYKL